MKPTEAGAYREISYSTVHRPVVPAAHGQPYWPVRMTVHTRYLIVTASPLTACRTDGGFHRRQESEHNHRASASSRPSSFGTPTGVYYLHLLFFRSPFVYHVRISRACNLSQLQTSFASQPSATRVSPFADPLVRPSHRVSQLVPTRCNITQRLSRAIDEWHAASPVLHKHGTCLPTDTMPLTVLRRRLPPRLSRPSLCLQPSITISCIVIVAVSCLPFVLPSPTCTYIRRGGLRQPCYILLGGLKRSWTVHLRSDDDSLFLYPA